MVQMVREFFLQSQEKVREKSGNFFRQVQWAPCGFSAFFLLTSRHKALSSTDVISSTDEFINFKIELCFSAVIPVNCVLRVFCESIVFFDMSIVFCVI